MSEIWKDISGFEGVYQVSNLGRVKSIERNCKHNITGYTRKVSEKILAPAISSGYHLVMLCKNGERYNKMVHRLVAEAFIPNLGDKREVNHKNCNKTDNRIENLEWVTSSENKIHAFRNNIMSALKGEKSCLSKLTESDIIKIRSLYSETDLNQYEIAKMFDIDQSNVSVIVNNKSWAHLNNSKEQIRDLEAEIRKARGQS